MLHTTQTIIHNGKPLPITGHDTVAASSVKVPSKREAQRAFDILQSAAVDALHINPEVPAALATLQRFLETR